MKLSEAYKKTIKGSGYEIGVEIFRRASSYEEYKLTLIKGRWPKSDEVITKLGGHTYLGGKYIGKVEGKKEPTSIMFKLHTD